MKFSNVFRTVAVVAAVAFAAGASAQDVTPIDDASFTNGTSDVVVSWLGDPGLPNAAYRVYSKSSLTDTNEGWEAASGFVTPITSWTLDATVEVPSGNNVTFFRVERIDREGPAIEYISPAKDAVSVPVDAEISVRITDESGVVEDNSMAIYVGDVRHAYGDNDVTWDGSVLTYTGGNLGNPGDTVDVWATAKDIKGNVGSSEQSLLVLESAVAPVTSSEPQVVPFLVIGAGEESVDELVDKVSDSPGTAARSVAASKATGSDTLEIIETTESTLVFAYTGNAWTLLAEEQLWASENADNIFYRKIVSIGEPDETTSTITVDTAEATLADFFVGGSFSSDDSEWAEYDVVGFVEGEEAGPQSRRRLVRPRIGGSTAKNFATNGVIKSDWLNNKIPANVPLQFEGNLGEWDVGAGFSVAADFGILKRKFNSCELGVNGNVHVYLHPKLVATTNAQYSNTWTKTIANVKKTFAGAIGPVPIWVDVGVEVPVVLSVQAQATNASVKAEIDISRALDFRWRLTDDQWKQIGSGNTGWVIARTNFTYEVVGSAGVRASIKPELTIKVYSLVGAYGWVEPYLEANASGYVRGQNLQAPEFYYLMTAYAGLNAEIGLASTIWSDSWGTPPHKSFSPLRKELLRIEGTNTPPSFASKPFDYEAQDGETVMLSALAKGTPPLRYTWYHNGVDTGRRENYITMTAAESTTGRYTVEVRNGYGTNSASAVLTLATNTPEVGLVGTWRFLYQWEGDGAYSYAARIYADGSMHDTSPNDYWWDWHLNGKTVRFETREKWNGAPAVYRGARWNDKFMSGTMTSPSGLTGTWSMEWVSGDPEEPVAGLRSVRAARADGEAEEGHLPLFDPAGVPLDNGAEAISSDREGSSDNQRRFIRVRRNFRRMGGRTSVAAVVEGEEGEESGGDAVDGGTVGELVLAHGDVFVAGNESGDDFDGVAGADAESDVGGAGGVAVGDEDDVAVENADDGGSGD